MVVLLSFHVDLGVHHLDCGDLGVCHFLIFHCDHCGGFCVCCLDCDDLGVHHFDFDHGVCCFGDLGVCHLSYLDLNGHVVHHVDDIGVCHFNDLHVYHFGQDVGKIRDF
jgi:hypothetical protein